jgi:hypothetical protein
MSILLVCRKIRREALPFLLEEHRFFSSLGALSKWTAAGTPELLQYVKWISVDAYENSLSSFGERLDEWWQCQDKLAVVPNTSLWWEGQYAQQASLSEPAEIFQELPDNQETEQKMSTISNVWIALKSLPGLRSIWVDSGRSHRSRSMGPSLAVEERLILSMVAAACQELQHLTFFCSLIHLDFISSFHQLRRLCFSGYSLSTPTQLSEILRHSTQLDEICLKQYAEEYDIERGITIEDLPKHVSFTSEVLRGLPPLKSFEIMHLTCTLPSDFLTVEMLKSLEEHKQTLTVLDLQSSWPVSKEVVEAILELLSSSRIRRLRLIITTPGEYRKLPLHDYFPGTLRQYFCKLRTVEFGISGTWEGL